MRHVLLATAVAIAVRAAPAGAADWSLALFGGYQEGAGGRIAGTVSDLAAGLPLALSAGLGYAMRDPGDPLQARAVFINANTNGTPEKSGRAWDLRLDLVWMLPIRGLAEAGVFAGVRHSWFMGDFKYVGGNEDFEVTASQWGYGIGFRGAVAMSPQWSLAFSVGFDHYPAWTLTGHDATYSSDGTSINARDGHTPGDADRAINQPKFVPSVLLGVAWRPGGHPARHR